MEEPLIEMDTPVWTPAPDETPAWPIEEPQAAPPAPAAEPEIPAVEPVAPAPVVWNLDAPAEAPAEAPPAPAPDPEPAPEPAPPVAAWIDPLPEIAPPPAPEPAALPAPVPETVAVEADPPADIRDQSRAVADLAPLLEGLLPLTRISDRSGVTPRMLVLMRALAEGPLSVSEQARRLDVSRPVVADLSARLESQGLARRERDETDRRRVRIALTDLGRRVCHEAPPADPDAIASALARMQPHEREGLLGGLRALEREAARWPSPTRRERLRGSRG